MAFFSKYLSIYFALKPDFRCNKWCSYAHSRKPTSSNFNNELNKASTRKVSLSTFGNRASLQKFLHEKCKSDDITSNAAFYFFDCMVKMQPSPPIPSFNILLSALAKKKQYDSVVFIYRRMNSSGLLPNLVGQTILIDCFCDMGRVSDGFVVLGRILRNCFSPNVVTFSSLIKGLCREGRIMEATKLFRKLIAFGCKPNVITYNTLMNGLCRTSNTSAATKLFEEMVNGNGDFGGICKPDTVTYNIIIDGLCKNGFVDKAKELFMHMTDRNIKPDVFTYNSLIHGYCCANDWKEAKYLFIDMMDQGVQPNVVTFMACLGRGFALYYMWAHAFH